MYFKKIDISTFSLSLYFPVLTTFREMWDEKARRIKMLHLMNPISFTCANQQLASVAIASM